MARKDDDEGGIDPNAWMATFSDLLSLLLTFFVLLFAMKSVDKGKLEETLSYFRGGGIGILESGQFMPLVRREGVDVREQITPISAADLKKMIEKRDFSKELNVTSHKNLNVTSQRQGLVVSLPGALLFDSGTADLTPRAEEILGEMIDLLKMTDFNFQVVGHTDDLPISDARYASNWELSIARAGKVLRVLLDAGGMSPDRFSIVGYGATRPIHPNNTPENRAANRRVEIILLR